MPELDQPLIVFTDVEGTLLDSHTQLWEPARDWLLRLKQHNVPVVLCSSKTAVEMMLLQKELELGAQPLIAENGAVIQLAADWQNEEDYPRLITGSPHEEIQRILQQLRENDGFKFTTFSDVNEQTISEWTGMNLRHAELSRLHEASETLIWRDTDEKMLEFTTTLSSLGLQFVQGARFWHVLDERGGKAQAITWLLSRYQEREGFRRVSIGLGDGPNDAPLLDATDYAVVVKGLNREGVRLKDDSPQRVFHTRESGPNGWREGLDYWLSSS
ncbi:mannosyl-3-phosphoglycerate phosphatase-related protein [Scandinavium sp. TWS1a]|uniref:mannosyl-3-phosphoglycerate phosphatase-related protein n=1 Tax=Scandinavium tedordense TaxID=2926521 RepID=UPI001358A044|nr:mannosyl-3-phosphoglycerate phosphatase-related protein [Scandinavium tedordense]MCS2171681.1 mannosyl-3-phosphoglycerate phosphatase-related protein [Scandinavium tedordense]